MADTKITAAAAPATLTDEEKIKAAKRAYNKARSAEYCKRWREKNRERWRKYQRRWARKNRKHLREYQRQWRKANPDKCRKYQDTYFLRHYEELTQGVNNSD